MNDKLQEIKQRWQDAPKGPWKWVGDRWLMPANYSDAGDYILLKTKTELGSSHYSDLITNSPTDVKWLIEQLEQERAKTKVELWICPDCGFGFDAGHTDVSTGEHSCPCCSELELEKRLEQAQAANQKLVECLEWYAEENNHKINVTDQWEPVIPLSDDRGQRARQTLIEVK